MKFLGLFLTFWILMAGFVPIHKTMAGSMEQAESASLTEPLEDVLYPRFLNTPLAHPRLISATVITAEDISRYCPGCDFIDVLERAGVNVRRFHGKFYQSSDTDAVYLSVRGVSEAQTSFYIDGVRVRDAMLGEPEWNFVATHNIERIEIVRGPTSTGNTNIGGEIRVYTKKANCDKEKEFCSYVKTELSNKPTTGGSAYVSMAKQTDQSSLMISAQGDKSRDPHGIPTVDSSSHYKERVLNISANHRSQDNKWLLEGQSTFYNSRNKGNITPSPKKGASNVVSLGSTYYIDPNLLIKSLVGYNKEQQRYGKRETKYTSRRISLNLWGEYHFEFMDGNYILKTGVEKHREKIYAPAGTYDSDRRDTIATFGSLSGERGPFTYQVTARVDNLSGDIDKKVWTWNGAISWHVARVKSHDISIRSGVGTGFRAPGFDEQYFIYSVPKGSVYKNNPDLDIEKAFNYEFGLRLERQAEESAPHYFLDITAFNIKLKDSVITVIEREYTDEEENDFLIVRRLDNQEEGRVQGLEFQAGFYLEPCKGVGNMTVVDSDDMESVRGHDPVRQLGSLSLSCFMNPYLSVGTNLTYRGDREGHIIHHDSASVWDAHLTWTPKPHKKNLKFQLALRNIGDKEYDLYNYTDGPGRTLWLVFSTPLF